jgi:hypothetical protein
MAAHRGQIDRRDGPNIWVVGLGVLTVAALLIWMALHVWQRPRPSDAARRTPLSAEAEKLSYTAEEDFRSDQSMAAGTLRRVLDGAAGGQILWENPETGNRGLVWNGPENARGCREVERRTVINHAFRDFGAMVCRDSRGRWPSEIAWAPR